MTDRKTVLITGAGSGIGRALAIEAVRLGYEPLLVGRTRVALEETAELAGLDESAVLVGDVTCAEDRCRLADATGGQLDVLINNAGCLSVGHLADLDDADLRRMAETNLVAPIALTRDMLGALGAAGGRVVNIGSVFGDIAYPYFSAYSAMKFGLRGFSDAIRRELSGSGIGVTYIAPRATRTAAHGQFGPLVEPLQMTLDSAERVAAEAWEAIRAGRRESFPRGKERFFVKVQRLFPALVDTSVSARARAPATLDALKNMRRA